MSCSSRGPCQAGQMMERNSCSSPERMMKSMERRRRLKFTVRPAVGQVVQGRLEVHGHHVDQPLLGQVLDNSVALAIGIQLYREAGLLK